MWTGNLGNATTGALVAANVTGTAGTNVTATATITNPAKTKSSSCNVIINPKLSAKCTITSPSTAVYDPVADSWSGISLGQQITFKTDNPPSGGIGPYTFDWSDSNVPGQGGALNGSTITGTPTAAGSFSAKVVVTDSASPSHTATGVCNVKIDKDPLKVVCYYTYSKVQNKIVRGGVYHNYPITAEVYSVSNKNSDNAYPNTYVWSVTTNPTNVIPPVLVVKSQSGAKTVSYNTGWMTSSQQPQNPPSVTVTAGGQTGSIKCTQRSPLPPPLPTASLLDIWKNFFGKVFHKK
jgi:hypothetical protein